MSGVRVVRSPRGYRSVGMMLDRSRTPGGRRSALQPHHQLVVAGRGGGDVTDPRRVDPPNCGCADCATGRSRRATTEAEYERAAQHNPETAED